MSTQGKFIGKNLLILSGERFTIESKELDSILEIVATWCKCIGKNLFILSSEWFLIFKIDSLGQTQERKDSELHLLLIIIILYHIFSNLKI